MNPSGSVTTMFSTTRRIVTLRETGHGDDDYRKLGIDPTHIDRLLEAEKSSGGFVGWFVLRPAEDGGMAKMLAEGPEDAELGYRLKRDAWGKGYATEGSRALVEKGFRELGVGRVVALADKDNVASIRVMEKVGLRFERVLSEPESLEGIMEAVGYALKREEFIAE